MTASLRRAAGRSCVLAASFLLASGAVYAQSAPSPEQRRQASAAFDQGTAARAAGENATAASLFETADRLAPSPQALGNAIRAHREVHEPGHDARAATLALRLLARYGTNPRMSSYAENLVRELSPALTRVEVRCGGCEFEVDQRLVADHEFFVEPGAHTLLAHWGEQTRTRDFTAQSGGREALELAAPPPAPAVRAPGGGTAAPDGNGNSVVDARPAPRGGLHPAIAISGAVATAALGGVLVWSGIDALNGVPAYMANPTPEGLADGQGRELRTNVLIGVTSVVGAATVAAVLFTRWNRGGAASAEAPRASVTAVPLAFGRDGAAPGVTLGGSF